MSYDVFVFKFAETYADLDAIPGDAKEMPMGAADAVRSAIDADFPGVNWNDPAWGVWDSDLGSIEFNVGNDDPVTGVALHIRAQSAVMTGVVALCRNNGWQAMDGDEDFVEQRSQPADGLNAWRAYRDKVIKP